MVESMANKIKNEKVTKPTKYSIRRSSVPNFEIRSRIQNTWLGKVDKIRRWCKYLDILNKAGLHGRRACPCHIGKWKQRPYEWGLIFTLIKTSDI